MSSAPEFFLHTPRLSFREWTDADGGLAWALWGDQEVMAYLGGPQSREQVGQRLAKHMGFAARAGVQYWPMFVRDGGAFVGCCGLRPPRDGVYEHGFHLCRRFWRRGYGLEASRAVIRHAFETLGALGVWAGHHPENDASRELIGRLRMSYAGDVFYAPTGRMHPTYRLMAEDWRARNSDLR